MLPFTDIDEESRLKHTQQALAFMEQSSQSEARKWESSLRNNIGYSLHQLGRLDEALAMFESNIAVNERSGNVGRTRIAYWMVAWTLRSLGRLDDALAIQLRLEREHDSDGTPDVYVYEELAKLYEAKGDTEQARHYGALAKRPIAPSS
ncbi:MAG: tetratricopeptide repeat protein [Gammaproteobacteria bacterium]|nr:tetratricopeptide repeat protein [Gammaproteobacteria bacterium]